MRRSGRGNTAPGATAPPGRVRIIGGRFRRTPIAVARVEGLRPTPDRVRGTVFNWLEHLLGGCAGRRGLDLFAGTGALGFELASRGAADVVLVENHADALRALRALAQRLPEAAVRIEAADWRSAVARLPPGVFDIVFLDPPFASGLLGPALAAAARLVAPGGLVYAEAAQALSPAELEAGPWQVVRADRAGAVWFHLLQLRRS